MTFLYCACYFTFHFIGWFNRQCAFNAVHWSFPVGPSLATCRRGSTVIPRETCALLCKLFLSASMNWKLINPFHRQWQLVVLLHTPTLILNLLAVANPTTVATTSLVLILPPFTITHELQCKAETGYRAHMETICWLIEVLLATTAGDKFAWLLRCFHRTTIYFNARKSIKLY
jgi:hypothetical protein